WKSVERASPMRVGGLSFAMSAIVVGTRGSCTSAAAWSDIVSMRQSVPPQAGPGAVGRSGAAESPAARAQEAIIPTTTAGARARRPDWAAFTRSPESLLTTPQWCEVTGRYYEQQD